MLRIVQEIYKTDYSYIETKPDLKGKRVGQILRESMDMVDRIVQCFIENKGNYRDFIPCCRKLKKGPSRRLYTKELDKQTSVVISSLCPFESRNRNHWLKELREKKTYLRLHQKFGNVWHGYPFRDIYSDRPFHKYLISKDIVPEHSGCVICPIGVAYNKWKEGLR